MQRESPYFIVADTLDELADKMNALTQSHDIKAETTLPWPMILMPILPTAINWKTTTKFAVFYTRASGARPFAYLQTRPVTAKGAGPFIAIHMQLITRKAWAACAPTLHSRVLNAQNNPIAGLYCVGEAAGFGGGNSNGIRSLEGTFLPSCILTARAAAKAINK